MAANRDVALNIIADIKKYQAELGKVPGLTEKQAAKAALSLQKELTKGQREAAKQARRAAEQSAQAWSNFGSVLAANLSVDAIKTAGAALVGFVDGIVSSVDEINTFGAATGLANETVAGLALAAKSSGKELTQILPSDLSKRMLDAANGLERQARGFRQLGVEVTDGNGKLRSSDAVLRELIDSLQAVEDPTERAALATQILGTTGQELLTAFESSEGLDAFVGTAQKFGNNVGPDAVAAAGAWQAATAELALAFEFAGREFLEGIGGPGAIAGFVRNFTLGFTVVGKFIRAFSTEVLGVLQAQLGSIAAFMRGDFAEAQRLFSKGFDPTGGLFFAALERSKNEALAAGQAMFDLRVEVDKAGGVTKDATRTINGFVGAQKDAAKASRDWGKEQERLAKEGIKLTEQLAGVVVKASEDQLDAEGKILRSREAQENQIAAVKARLEELGRAGIDVARAQSLAEQAAIEVSARARRDLDALRQEQHEAELERIDELRQAEIDAAEQRKEEREQELAEQSAAFSQAVDLVQGFGNVAFGVLTELQRRQTAAARDALDDARDAISELRDERAALTEQLLEEESEIERARISARLNELDAELETSKKARKNARKSALKSWKAEQALALSGIAFNTAAAVLKAYAMFGPPPSPIGVTSAALAGAAGITQAALVATEKPPQFHTGIESTRGLTASFTRAGDEQLAALTSDEAVLNGRAADRFGRDQIRELNATGDAGGAPVFELMFERRHVDTMVARTLNSGGRARTTVNRITRSRPAGQIAVVGA